MIVLNDVNASILPWILTNDFVTLKQRWTLKDMTWVEIMYNVEFRFNE